MASETPPLAASRSEWRALAETLHQAKKHEENLRQETKRIRDLLAEADASPDERSKQERALAKLRDAWSEALQAVRRHEEEHIRLALALSERSRADGSLAVAEAESAPEAQRAFEWSVAKERVLDGLAERLTALVRTGDRLRGVAARAGISTAHLARMMHGQRPGDEPLKALAAAYPDVFHDLVRVMEEAPPAPRSPGRPLRSKADPARGPGKSQAIRSLVRMSGFRLDASGRPERLPDVFERFLSPMMLVDAEYAILVEGDWAAPEIQRGDLVFVDTNALHGPGRWLIVEDCQRRTSFRRLALDSMGELVYAAKEQNRFPNLWRSEAQGCGVVTGLLRGVRLDLPSVLNAFDSPDGST